MGRSATNKNRMTGLSLVSNTFRGLSLPTQRVTVDFGQSVLSLETRLQYDGTASHGGAVAEELCFAVNGDTLQIRHDSDNANVIF